jgi:hypothetical protein
MGLRSEPDLRLRERFWYRRVEIGASKKIFVLRATLSKIAKYHCISKRWESHAHCSAHYPLGYDRLGLNTADAEEEG